MKVNLAYVYDILARMIEAQYMDGMTPDAYAGFIQDYQNVTDPQRTPESMTHFRAGLRDCLKGLLNNPHLPYDDFFEEGAMHGFGSHDDARRVFERIWIAYFGEEEWQDEQFEGPHIELVEEPFMG